MPKYIVCYKAPDEKVREGEESVIGQVFPDATLLSGDISTDKMRVWIAETPLSASEICAHLQGSLGLDEKVLAAEIREMEFVPPKQKGDSFWDLLQAHLGPRG